MTINIYIHVHFADNFIHFCLFGGLAAIFILLPATDNEHLTAVLIFFIATSDHDGHSASLES